MANADYNISDSLGLVEYNAQMANAIKYTNDYIKSLKDLNTAVQSGVKIRATEIEATKKETAAKSELQKLQILRDKTIEKSVALDRKAAKELAKVRLEVQKKNKAIKDEIIAEDKANNAIKQGNAALKIQVKSKADAKRQTALLRGAVNELDLTTKKGIATEKIYNAQIDKNTVFLKKNSDTQSKAKQSVGGYTAGINKSTLAVGSMGSSLSMMPGVLGRVGFAMTTVGTAAKTLFANPIFLAIGAVALLVKTLGSALKVAKEFQSANADLAATLGVTRKETVLLQKSQKELGKTTAFSAIEVAGLQNEYAKLGFAQDEIIELSKATIDLSVATRQSADETASFVGGIINSFGLSVTEAVRVADVTAKAAASSALDFTKLSTALPIVSTTAKNAGKDLEFVTSQLGILADRNIDASTSGTALRNIYLELSKRGITYDAALQMINESSNKNATAMELFGKRGATVATVLAENIVQVNELEKVLDNAGGTAERVASQKLNTLEGATTLLKSAFEGLKLTIVDGEGIFIRLATGAVKILTVSVNTLSKSFAILSGTFQVTFNSLNVAMTNSAIQMAVWAERVKQIIAKVPIIGKKIDVSKSEAALNTFKEQQEGNVKKLSESWTKLGQLITNNYTPTSLNAKPITTTAEAVNELAEAFVELGMKAAKNAGLEDLGIKAFAKKEDVDEVKANIKDAADFAISETQRSLSEQSNSYDDSFDDRKEYYDKLKDAQESLNDELISSGEKIIVDRLGANIDDNLAKFESAQDAKKDILKQRLDDGVISEEAYQKEIAAIDLRSRQENAKAEKKKALFEIAISTLSASIQALPNLVLSGLVLASGIAAGIAVAAEPIPQFKDGVLNFGGGEAIVGDGGESELVIEPNRGVWVTPDTATRTSLEKGASVYNKEQAMSTFGLDVSKLEGMTSDTNRLLKRIVNKEGDAMTAHQHANNLKKQDYRKRIADKRKG